jgi:hypothetical protein
MSTEQPVNLGQFGVGMSPKFTARCFSESTGLLTDPTGLKFVTRNPAGTEDDKVYGTDSEVTKVSTGVYQYAFGTIVNANEGVWHLRCNASGVLVSAREGTFEVVNSVFTDPLP